MVFFDFLSHITLFILFHVYKGFWFLYLCRALCTFFHEGVFVFEFIMYIFVFICLFFFKEQKWHEKDLEGLE